MKTWHCMAATAWVALFLGLARGAAVFLGDSRPDPWNRLWFALAGTGLFVVTAAGLTWSWFAVPGLQWLADEDEAGCLVPLAAIGIVVSAIGMFCWLGAG